MEDCNCTSALWAWITENRTIVLFGIYFLYMSVVQALPAIEPTDGKGYRFVYKLLHGLSANWGLVAKVIDKPKIDWTKGLK